MKYSKTELDVIDLMATYYQHFKNLIIVKFRFPQVLFKIYDLVFDDHNAFAFE